MSGRVFWMGGKGRDRGWERGGRKDKEAEWRGREEDYHHTVDR